VPAGAGERFALNRPSWTDDECLPPQDLHAEQAVLGSLLIEPRAQALVLPHLHGEDFYRDAHKTIFEAILAVAAREDPVDLVPVCDELRRLGKLDGVGGPAYLQAMIHETPTAAHVRKYAEIVRKKAALRRCITAAADLQEEAYKGPDDVGGLIARGQDLLAGIGESVDRRGEGVLLTYQELLRRERTDPPWRVEGLFVKEGIALLSGDAGAGKTWLSLTFACSVASGEAALGAFPVEQGPVVYYDLEAGEHLLAQRLALLARAHPTWRTELPIHVRVRPELDLARAETLRILQQDLDEFHPALLVLDPLRAAYAADEDRSHAVRPIYTTLGRLIQGTGASVLLPHHVRKLQPGGAQSGLNAASQRARGSGDHRAAVDSHLTLTREGRGRVRVDQEKSRHAEPVPSFLFALEVEGDGLVPRYIPMTPKAAGTIATAEAMMLTALRDTDGPVLRADLLAACKAKGIPPRTAEEALKRLRESGSIEAAPREGQHVSYALAQGEPE
jgi:hypothetical protein